ncbi:hypothetical protein [Mycobacterium paragordonae]|uniref:hypothetical protein n=1 Tax=Mycobacterium paragordonae TaxID=1389713 RepID=UPI0012E0FFA6|nr:hypothetical protein [Mycobacterium paragordonae]
MTDTDEYDDWDDRPPPHRWVVIWTDFSALYDGPKNGRLQSQFSFWDDHAAAAAEIQRRHEHAPFMLDLQAVYNRSRRRHPETRLPNDARMIREREPKTNYQLRRDRERANNNTES